MADSFTVRLPGGRLGRPPVVGRVRELAALDQHLAEVRAGQPLLVMVSGPPGIGKTRVLEEFTTATLAQDVTVLRGGTSRAEGMPAYLPLLQALGEYIAAAPAELLHQQLGPHAETLVQVFPELEQHVSRTVARAPIGPELERYRLFEGLSAFFGAMAAARTVVLLIDDVQWLDPATCDALVYVLGRLRSARLLLLAACRDGEMDPNVALTAALAELDRVRRLAVLKVNALEVAETAHLIGALLHGDAAPELAHALHQRSEGNPFFLEELVRGLVETDALAASPTGWTLAPRAQPLLPPRVAWAIEQRLARLEPSIVDALRVAAVVGRASDPHVVAHAAGQTVAQMEDRLRAAQRAYVVRPEPGGEYSFTHDLIRETLLDQLGPTAQQQLHAAIGEALEMRHDGDDVGRLADLAFHYAAAGDPDKGVSYALVAADQALKTSAPHDAVTQLESALRLLGDKVPPERPAAILMRLGEAARLAGYYPRAVEAYESAAATWQRAGDALAEATAWYELGRVQWRLEAIEPARHAFERGMALVREREQASPQAAELALQLADLHATSLGQQEVGLAFAERALAMLDALDCQGIPSPGIVASPEVQLRRLRARTFSVLGNIRARGQDLEGARELLEQALELARAEDDPSLTADVCAYLANLYAWLGEMDRSRDVSRLRAEMARRTHDPFHLRHVYSWIGFLDGLRGRWELAEASFAEQERLVEGLAAPEPRAILRTYRAAQHYLLGHFEEAERAYREAIELLRPTGSATLIWHFGPFALVLAEQGKLVEARACLEELWRLAETLDVATNARAFAFAHLAVGYMRLGERERAAACYPNLLPFRGMVSPILVDHALGLAAAARGDPAAARQHLLEAESLARRLDWRPKLVLILVQRGVLVEDATSGRNSVLAEGQSLALEFGMQELARRLMRPVDFGSRSRSGGRSRSGPQKRNVAGLSDRELEVLRLVAEGRTNRDIAGLLVLSDKTVARHLTTIFAKTGLDNRAGATAFALRHGLA